MPRQPLKPRAVMVVPMRRRDMYQHPDFGTLSRDEFVQLQSRGPSAVPLHRVHRAMQQTHGANPNWIAMHHTADQFGFKLKKTTKSLRVYQHPGSKDTLRLHWNDPRNDAWSFEFGAHQHKHERHDVCNAGVSNEDLSTHLARASTDAPRWICQHALNRMEPEMVRKHRFEEQQKISHINTPRFEHLIEVRRSMYSLGRLGNASGMRSNPSYALSARHVTRRYASHPRTHRWTHPHPLSLQSLYWAPGVLIPADVTGASQRQIARITHTS